MPRKSVAALSVVANTHIDGRPRPPADLTTAQKRLWDKVVATEPADLFATEATQQLLRNYCRHVTAADHFSRLVDAHIAFGQLPPDQRPDVLPISLPDMKLLLQMRARETDGAIRCAVKLRLTNQSRYGPRAAATAGRQASSPTRPWDDAG